MIKKESNILALDIGVTSVGHALVKRHPTNDEQNIIDYGVRIVPSINDKKEAREYRGSRRMNRRKKNKKSFIKKMFLNPDYFSNLENLKNMKEVDKSFILNKNDKNVHELFLEGMARKLTSQELLRVCYYFFGHRGYKSNRKNTTDKEEGKLLESLSLMQKEMDDWNILFISEYILEKAKTSNDFKVYGELITRNKKNSYSFTTLREMVIFQMLSLLDKQIEFGLINENFKIKYMDILEYQIPFSKGPATGKYSDPLNKSAGKCRIDGNVNMVKMAPSYEMFTLMTSLQNISYNIEGNNTKYSLEIEEINEIFNLTNKKISIIYKDILKLIGKNKNIDIEKINIRNISIKTKNKEDDKEKLEAICKKEICSLKGTAAINKQLKNSNIQLKNIIEKDKIASVFTKYKTDEEIFEKLNELKILKDDDSLLTADEVKSLLDIDETKFKEYGRYSDNLIHKINKLILDSNFKMNRHDAIEKIIKEHNIANPENKYKEQNVVDNKNCFKFMPMIDKLVKDMGISGLNRTTKNILKECRDILNEYIKLHGRPCEIHIELARELSMSDSEKNDYTSNVYSNYINRIKLKEEIFSKYSHAFKNLNAIEFDDILKYELAKEQKFIDFYAVLNGEENIKISEYNLFSNDYEVDHIDPFSKSYNNRKYNKIVTRKRLNDLKGDNLPLNSNLCKQKEKYESMINQIFKNSYKIKRLLATETYITEFRYNTLNDTRFITKTFKEMLRYCFSDIKIVSINGFFTDKLKGLWGLKNLTSSYKSYDYKNVHNDEEKEICQNKLSQVNSIIDDSLDKEDKYLYVLSQLTKLKENENEKNIDRLNLLYNSLDKLNNLKDVADMFIKKEKICDENLNIFIESIEKLKNKGLILYFIYQFYGYTKGFKKKLDIQEAEKQKNYHNFGDLKEMIYQTLIKEFLFIYENELTLLEKESDKKDRSNHLHHILDAIIIGFVNDDVEKELKRFETERENPNKKEIVVQFWDTKNEKMIYKKVENRQYQNKQYFATPYEKFRDDVIINIYEFDIDRKRNSLKELALYTDKQLKKILPVVVSHKEFEVTMQTNMKLHEDTKYGLTDNKELFVRKDITTEKFNKKQLDEMIDKDNPLNPGARTTYNIILEWLRNPKNNEKFLNGKEAFKIKGGYPLYSNGNRIKKIKIFDKMLGDEHCLNNNQYVSKGNVVQVLLIEDVEGNKYFSGIDLFTFRNMKNNPTISIWDKECNVTYLTVNELEEKGLKIIDTFNKNSTLKVKFTKTSKEIICLLCGFTKGKIEFKSIVGDSYDFAYIGLTDENKVNSGTRIQKSGNRIESIKKVNVSLLGKIIEDES